MVKLRTIIKKVWLSALQLYQWAIENNLIGHECDIVPVQGVVCVDFFKVRLTILSVLLTKTLVRSTTEVSEQRRVPTLLSELCCSQRWRYQPASWCSRVKWSCVVWLQLPSFCLPAAWSWASSVQWVYRGKHCLITVFRQTEGKRKTLDNFLMFCHQKWPLSRFIKHNLIHNNCERIDSCSFK